MESEQAMVKCERKGRMDGSCEGSKCEWYGNKEKRNVEPYITDDGTKAE